MKTIDLYKLHVKLTSFYWLRMRERVGLLFTRSANFIAFWLQIPLN